MIHGLCHGLRLQLNIIMMIWVNSLWSPPSLTAYTIQISADARDQLYSQRSTSMAIGIVSAKRPSTSAAELSTWKWLWYHHYTMSDFNTKQTKILYIDWCDGNREQCRPRRPCRKYSHRQWLGSIKWTVFVRHSHTVLIDQWIFRSKMQSIRFSCKSATVRFTKAIEEIHKNAKL